MGVATAGLEPAFSRLQGGCCLTGKGRSSSATWPKIMRLLPTRWLGPHSIQCSSARNLKVPFPSVSNLSRQAER
jgi:hypothetical protein